MKRKPKITLLHDPNLLKGSARELVFWGLYLGLSSGLAIALLRRWVQQRRAQAQPTRLAGSKSPKRNLRHA